MDQSEIGKLDLSASQFSPAQLTLTESDIGSGQEVDITVQNMFGDTSTCTLYYQVIGEIIYYWSKSTCSYREIDDIREQ